MKGVQEFVAKNRFPFEQKHSSACYDTEYELGIWAGKSSLTSTIIHAKRIYKLI